MSTDNIYFPGEMRYQHFSDEKSTLSVTSYAPTCGDPWLPWDETCMLYRNS